MNKKLLKLILKLLLTGAALFLVFRKIEVDKTWEVIKNADKGWLLAAMLLFILSKIFCAFRLNLYFKDLGLRISEKMNLKLYAIGMFYNLFLPGGIGGDGYKVYLLNKLHKTPVSQVLSAVLLDRGNGLSVLIFLVFVLVFFVEFQLPFGLQAQSIGFAGLLLIPIATYMITRYFFGRFMGSILPTTGYSFLNQLLQLVSTFFILKSLGIDQQVPEYLFVFLLSSTVAILPLTIGGVGARELVFVYAHEIIGIDKNAAVAFSLLFFIITVLTSLSGLFFKFKVEEPDAVAEG